jgi:hypothetical protein
MAKGKKRIDVLSNSELPGMPEGRGGILFGTATWEDARQRYRDEIWHEIVAVGAAAAVAAPHRPTHIPLEQAGTLLLRATLVLQSNMGWETYKQYMQVLGWLWIKGRVTNKNGNKRMTGSRSAEIDSFIRNATGAIGRLGRISGPISLITRPLWKSFAPHLVTGMCCLPHADGEVV